MAHKFFYYWRLWYGPLVHIHHSSSQTCFGYNSASIGLKIFWKREKRADRKKKEETRIDLSKKCFNTYSQWPFMPKLGVT